MTQQYIPTDPQRADKSPKSMARKLASVAVIIIITIVVACSLFVFEFVRYGQASRRTAAKIRSIDGIESVEIKSTELHVTYVIVATASRSREQVKQMYDTVQKTIVSSAGSGSQNDLDFSQDYRGAAISVTAPIYHLAGDVESPIESLINEIDAGALRATARYDGGRPEPFCACSAVYAQLPTDPGDQSYDGCHEMNRYTEEDA